MRPPSSGATWWQLEAASNVCAGLSDLGLAITARGVLHVLWCGYTEDDIRRLNHLRREPIFKQTTFMPIVAG